MLESTVKSLECIVQDVESFLYGVLYNVGNLHKLAFSEVQGRSGFRHTGSIIARYMVSGGKVI